MVTLAWIAFAAFFLGMGGSALRCLKGANDFPGTEAGLAGCAQVLVFAVGSIALVTLACVATFDGTPLIVALISGLAGVMASVFLILRLDVMDYDRKTMDNWRRMTREEQEQAVRFKPRYNHLKPGADEHIGRVL